MTLEHQDSLSKLECSVQQVASRKLQGFRFPDEVVAREALSRTRRQIGRLQTTQSPARILAGHADVSGIRGEGLHSKPLVG
jgi:hypothetical protein